MFLGSLFGTILVHFGNCGSTLAPKCHPGAPGRKMRGKCCFVGHPRGTPGSHFLAHVRSFCQLSGCFLKTCFLAGFWNLPWMGQCGSRSVNTISEWGSPCRQKARFWIIFGSLFGTISTHVGDFGSKKGVKKKGRNKCAKPVTQVISRNASKPPAVPLNWINGRLATSSQQTSNHSWAEWQTSNPAEALETLHWCPGARWRIYI